jgi:TatD DNase family protein
MKAQNRNIDVDRHLVYVDTHCHLDDEGFDTDLPDVLQHCREIGVTRWINVGFNPARWHTSIDLGRQYPGMAFMLGVHPGDADIWTANVHQELRVAVETHNPVAIGEIGLDFFRGETNHEIQIEAFDAQLDLALTAGIPAVIHMRSSEELLLDTIQRRQSLPPLLFHSFDGSPAIADWIIESGSFVGVGGLATRSKSRALQQELKRIPLERILLETDSPYLVPNGFKHRRNTPESIPRVAAFLADLLNVELETIASQTTRNAHRLFERLAEA